MTQLSDVLEGRSHPNVLLAAIISGTTRATGASATKYVTSARRLITGPADTPASIPFDAVLLPGWRLRRAVAKPGTYFQPSPSDWGALTLATSSGALTSWTGIDMEGHEIELRAGIDGERHGGGAFGWADWETIGTPKIKTRRKDAKGRYILNLSDTAANPDLRTESYGGFQGALNLPAGNRAYCAHHTSLDFVGGPLTIILTALIESGAPPSRLMRKKTAVTSGHAYGLKWETGDTLNFFSGASSIDATGTIATGDYRHYIAVIDGLNVNLYVGKKAADLALMGSGTMAATLPASTDVFEVGTTASTGTEKYWQAALIGEALSLDDLKNIIDRPISDSLPNLAHLWKFNETSGLVAAATVGGQDLTVDASGTWVTTYEGSDPEDFEGSPAGQIKPGLWGTGRGIPLVPVDPQRMIYAWDSETADGPVDAVHANGVGLTVTTQYTADLATSTVTFVGSVPAGTLTGDKTGRTAGGMTDLYATLGGTTPDTTGVTWDPDVWMLSPKDKPPNKDTALTGLARSACAWHARKRDGTRLIQTWTPPTGTAVMSFSGGGARGVIKSVEWLPAAAPAWRLVCRYAQAGVALDPGVIPGSVDADTREWLAKEWLTAERRDETIKSDWPASKERVVDTWLTTAADAEAWLDRAELLFMVPRRWPVVEVGGLAPFVLELGQEIYVQHDDPEYDLESGLYAIVHGIREGAAGTTRIWLWA